MNKRLTLHGLTALMLVACNPLASSDKLTAEDFEDFFEDYVDWKIDQDKVEIDPFKAKPILVTGTGTVRATPDIAVLTGMIRTKYKEAAEKAVENARQKAQISARIAGTNLTTVERFSVTGTERRTRYGRQATIISPHGNRSVTPQQRISFSDRVIRSQGTPRRARRNTPQYVAPAPAASFSCWDGSTVFSAGQCPAQPVMEVPAAYSGSTSSTSLGGGFTSGEPVFETISEPIVIQEASTELVTIPATYETVMETMVVQPAYNGTPAVTKQVPRRVLKNPGTSSQGAVATQSGASNALNETLLSGSKTIRVSATLSYNYETPLDGVIFKVPETD